MKHTKGPWKLNPDKSYDKSFSIVDSSNRHYVATVGKLFDNARANAELIARAPELLEENERLTKEIERVRKERDQMTHSYSILQRAYDHSEAQREALIIWNGKDSKEYRNLKKS